MHERLLTFEFLFPIELGIWRGMRSRCTNPRNPMYKYYGAKGVKVCERWNSFTNFMNDMKPRPTMKHSIDRYPDCNGDYEPANCRWANAKQQSRNKRTTLRVIYQGEEIALGDLCDRLGVSYRRVLSRLKYGWTIERAVSERKHCGKIAP